MSHYSRAQPASKIRNCLGFIVFEIQQLYFIPIETWLCQDFDDDQGDLDPSGKKA
jgi:hypothetical protein